MPIKVQALGTNAEGLYFYVSMELYEKYAFLTY